MTTFYGSRSAPVHSTFRGRGRWTGLSSLITWGGVAVAVAGCGSTAGSSDSVSPPADIAPQALCERIDRALTHARDDRLLDARVNGAWQVVHGILAFGDELPLATAEGKRHALPWLLGGGSLRGWRVRKGSQGLVATIEEGSTTGQGHPDQWIGYLAQCGLDGLPVDTPISVNGSPYTLRDLLAQARADIRPGREATWTLMALAAWVPPDDAWTAADGRRWTVEDVVAMEAAAEIDGAACGGCHRLYGLVTALDAHRAAQRAAGLADPVLRGGWADAANRIEDCIEIARRHQQPDGSFSVHFFERPGTSVDLFARLGATGHIFEFLVAALDDQRLAEPWITRAAERLVTLLEQSADVDVECGALYHAAHGLRLYRERVCGPTAADPPAD
jgi:hypothetical protein